MIVILTEKISDQKISVDKFAATAYNNPALMKFIQIAVQSFESAVTTQLVLHVKSGVPKGGDANFSF